MICVRGDQTALIEISIFFGANFLIKLKALIKVGFCRCNVIISNIVITLQIKNKCVF
jgi:hypothetical protein